jgi:hypothetical protein
MGSGIKGAMFAAGLTATFSMSAALAVPSTPADANLKVPPAMTTPDVTGPSGTKFGQIDGTAPRIVLTVEDTSVKIRRAPGISFITTTSNCPSHWNVQGNVIRQVVQSQPQKGVTLRAGSGGANITLNGQLYAIPQGVDGGIHSLKVENGVVTINGKKVEPLAGSTSPGVGPDTLEITVPENYSGGLSFTSQGTSSIDIDQWKNGPLEANIGGTSSLKVGNLSKLEKTIINVNGSGTAVVDNLSTKVLVANIEGAGIIDVKNGTADTSNATVSGTGVLRLRGEYKNMRKAVQGNGVIDVRE